MIKKRYAVFGYVSGKGLGKKTKDERQTIWLTKKKAIEDLKNFKKTNQEIRYISNGINKKGYGYRNLRIIEKGKVDK